MKEWFKSQKKPVQIFVVAAGLIVVLGIVTNLVQ